MNNGPGKWAEMVAYVGILLLPASEITLQEPLYYVGDFTEKKTCRRWASPISIVDQAHLTRRAKRSKRSRELFR
jgi:hypothetical protein